MFHLTVPWWEFVVRGVIVYLFLLVFLRITSRRQIGQYAPFDLVLLLLLSNAVQNSMNGGDNSLAGGLISAATLLTCHAVIGRLADRNVRLSRLIDGKPIVLINDGQLDERAMRQQGLTQDDLHAALRAGGCLYVREVRRATIEANGQITVVPKRDGPHGNAAPGALPVDADPLRAAAPPAAPGDAQATSFTPTSTTPDTPATRADQHD